MRRSEKAPRRRKRQPPKSGSQNARRALVETEIVWETSSALFLVSSGSLPPTLPSLSSTPRCRWCRDVSQHVQEARRRRKDGHVCRAVRVSTVTEWNRTIIQALLSPFASSLATSSRRRHCPRTRPAAAHASDARRVQHLAAKPPAVQGLGLAGAKFELQSQAARRSRPFFVDWSRAARETVTGLLLVPACPRASQNSAREWPTSAAWFHP